MESITEVKSDYYLTDATGHVVALRTSVTPTGLGTTTNWEYYVYDSEREARLVNLDSDPKFDDAEVSFYLTDHLGNTRISYTPMLTDVPDSTTNVFNSDFTLGTQGWVGSNAVASGGNLVVTNNVSNPSCNKSFAVVANNVYDFEFNVTPVPSSTLAVLINGTYLGSFSGADEVQYTASTTGTVQVTFVSAALGEFTVKEAVMDETVPAHTTVSYTVNYAADYFPYGKVLREYVAGDKERYLTTQHERDQETGLDYRGARYYDSDVARFLSLDAHASKYPSLSPYNYVGANPLIFVDPDGNDIIPASIKSYTMFMEYANSLLVGSEFEGKAIEFFGMGKRLNYSGGYSITSTNSDSVDKMIKNAMKAGVSDESKLQAIGELYLSLHLTGDVGVTFLYLEPGSKISDYDEFERDFQANIFKEQARGGMLNTLSTNNDVLMGYLPNEDILNEIINMTTENGGGIDFRVGNTYFRYSGGEGVTGSSLIAFPSLNVDNVMKVMGFLNRNRKLSDFENNRIKENSKDKSIEKL